MSPRPRRKAPRPRRARRARRAKSQSCPGFCARLSSIPPPSYHSFAAFHPCISIAHRAKKEKDPNAPKRPSTAYFLYANTRRAAVKEEHPEWKVSDIAKHLGAEWKNLSDAQKAPFVAEAAKKKAEVSDEYRSHNCLSSSPHLVSLCLTPLSTTLPRRHTTRGARAQQQRPTMTMRRKKTTTRMTRRTTNKRSAPDMVWRVFLEGMPSVTQGGGLGCVFLEETRVFFRTSAPSPSKRPFPAMGR